MIEDRGLTDTAFRHAWRSVPEGPLAIFRQPSILRNKVLLGPRMDRPSSDTAPLSSPGFSAAIMEIQAAMPSFRLWLLKHPDKDPATAVLYTVITADSQNAAIELVTERIRLQRPDIDLDEDYFFIVSKTPEETPRRSAVKTPESTCVE